VKLVLDSSALITLARIRRLDLLRQVAGAIRIPDAVYEEVVQAGQARHGSVEVAHAQWISRHQVKDQGAVARLRGRLGKGEAEAIVLACELQAEWWRLAFSSTSLSTALSSAGQERDHHRNP
jgi:predicted nucleic acid-binding protein